MNDIELKTLWQLYDQKLEESKVLNMQSWALNIKCFEELQSQKAKSKLNSLATYKIWMVIAGILWALFLIFLVVNSLQWSKIFFVISASMIALFTIIAIIVYIKHIILIREIDNTNNIIETQEKLASLQTSTLQIARILFLQAPFYTTFFWSFEMIQSNYLAFFTISLPITLLFCFVSIWLYKNISFKNKDKKWFKVLFSSTEWTTVIKAIDFMNEIETFKKDKS